MPSPPARMLLGFIAGVLSVLTFHQGMVELFHLADAAPPAWSMQLVPPYSVPRLVDLSFWGGLYGLVFGMFAPVLRPNWAFGIALGVIAAAVGWLVVAPLKGMPLGYGWDPAAMIRSLIINGVWGLGVGLILPRLMPDMPRGRRRYAA